MLDEKQIKQLVWQKYPRTDKEKQGCPSEIERMYHLRKAYRLKLEEGNKESEEERIEQFNQMNDIE